MAVSLAELDAHEQPSDEMRAEWKSFSKQEPEALMQHPRIDDPRLPLERSGFRQTAPIKREQLQQAFSDLDPEFVNLAREDAPVLFHPLLPGLLIVPSLVPAPIQIALLDRMLHRDLNNPVHQTNMHLHYTLPYPEPASSPSPPSRPSCSSPSLNHSSSSSQPAAPASQPPLPASFFSLPPNAPGTFTPKDPTVHKPLSARQVLQRRLHWVTLGGQYDWTNRVYPDAPPPAFPPDLAAFLEGLFPQTYAQAAIVNFYSPGDTMMMHRDVSEETDRGLVSLSFGCDCLFMIAPNDTSASSSSTKAQPETEGTKIARGEVLDDDNGAGDGAHGAATHHAETNEKKYLLLRLRSGDAIYMTKESRYAWHGVPKVLRGTCPDYLDSWPAQADGKYAEWEGWMKNKRINLNVRQMRD
ncbi:hypothetical protein JDV02_004359 [Purpureocillium takamizusanense]|uniref:Fe2OG dioxygenase domain-containing protein n=1 Tax=Purpureocillium takamizusanense TaxID=2060973 RepID=A0A9Q8VAP2_9HYPO|nr:uncharacterized protein JDV02_004359 [Purpureocillium takamizusanense]UNI18064.1 hypothetical protein JDV02_004359 [Purpureocillium takamizusanense]